MATRPGSMIVTNLGSPPGMPTHPGPGRAQRAARRSRRPARASRQRRWRRQRTQRRSGRSEFRTFGRQLQPVGAHRGAGRAGQLRFRSGPAQSQSQRHGRQRRCRNANFELCQQTTSLQDAEHSSSSSSSRREPPAPPLPPPPTQCRPPVPADAPRQAPARHSAGPQPAADGNRDIRWRNDRYRERPFDRYR